MKEVLKGYLWTVEFDDVDNDTLYTTCLNVEEDLKRLLPPIPSDKHNGYGCFTSYYHKHLNYNLYYLIIILFYILYHLLLLFD